VREWIHGLGIDTFVGSSGRVFPTDMKAAPLLRAWLHRLREAACASTCATAGWAGATAAGVRDARRRAPGAADAVVLALGGASWARLGSDGAWVPLLAERRVEVAPLVPANCGFDVDWSAHFSEPPRRRAADHRGAGVDDATAGAWRARASSWSPPPASRAAWCMPVGADPRPDRARRPGHGLARPAARPRCGAVLAEVTRPRGARSMSSHLQSRLGIKGVKAGLLHECLGKEDYADPAQSWRRDQGAAAGAAPAPDRRGDQQRGGVRFEAMEANGMLRALPGVFVAGEMVDWEAPTGGYLLTWRSRSTARARTGRAASPPSPAACARPARDIDSGRFVDYTELDAASNRGVDEVQSLLEQAVYKPVQGRFKVFMIDEVHMLTNTAFNAMLKTLEEPPEYLKFVLATTDPQKVPVTVLSRCLQFNLRPMAPETVQSTSGSVLRPRVPAERRRCGCCRARRAARCATRCR
jgi:DNA polymerase III delta prime subunit